MNSYVLQNPSEPNTFYRVKTGKAHKGYYTNLEETVGQNGLVVADYQYEPNTHTNSQFLKNTLSQIEKWEIIKLLKLFIFFKIILCHVF